jgi:hypothetical protein
MRESGKDYSGLGTSKEPVSRGVNGAYIRKCRFLAVFGGIPGDVWAGAIGFSIPTGLKLSAQGCEERATLGEEREKSQPCKG